MIDKKPPDKPPVWINWPLMLGLIVNFAVWALFGVWIAHRRH
jgi:hypothetical protein